ncbi:metal ABC transporter substrate-binding protein [Allostreptomyces psammosilenae]|uniref:Zinc transport system substrate-binding protein n=1 Tax=Allostreptomyces psammosilenae TaxID=1892865 RepID=A0A852ZM70_9ACTN|nr:metal ABC transporter substrate-binding protein [Allostreptomyces psammosilenae]NYI03489.1 zinc transport system substrate-binding protein [Allostreptomyces psammosilenae]
MKTNRASRTLLACATAVVLGAATAACGDSGSDSAEGGSTQVITGMYPMQWLAEQVGGTDVSVENLTEPGTEPHDLELTARQVGAVGEADLVVYIDGFQAAVDEAVDQQAADRAFDALVAVENPISGSEEGHAEEGHAEEGHAEEGHAEEGHAEEGHAEEGHAEEGHAEEGHAEGEAAHGEEGHEHGAEDPHIWLDPSRLAGVATALGDRLAEVDPDNADGYRERAQQVADDLAALDEEFSTGLAACDSRTVVTNHAAFGYLADRYDLEQVGISGLNPDSEPTPARMAEVAEIVEHEGVSTIYTETLISPDVAETLAAETGATTAVLDPVEGITDTSAGDDYPSVMRANLEALRQGLGCS